jgi:hypothetical protein
MKMLKTIECSEKLLLLLFCLSSIQLEELDVWFSLDVNFTDGFLVPCGLVVAVGSTISSPF